jgi:hypothetical protein
MLQVFLNLYDLNVSILSLVLNKLSSIDSKGIRAVEVELCVSGITCI